MSLRDHPVSQTIRHAAYFGHRAVPSKAELDRLALPADARRKVKRACENVAQIHDAGEHAAAWEAAESAEATIIGGLDEELRDPGYLNPPDPLGDVADPDELAARIPR